MRTRGNEAPPVTLFSFQDIITSVMGIMILVMLVIALELAARQLQSPAIQQAIVRQDVREALKLAQQKLEQIKYALAAGAWDNLAALNRGDVQRQTSELERLLPILEQNAQQALQRANRAYVLETGHIVRSDDAKVLLGDESVRAAYLGKAVT